MNDPRPLYDLLPAIHRTRDAERERALQKLLEVVEDERRRLVDDVDRLYDGWFIETCAERLVPYFADLLGVAGLSMVPGGPSRRALVANTIAYRRRKGTAAVLERLARDATGWPAVAVEQFSRLSTTAHLDHVRPGVGTADLRGPRGAPFGTPFDPGSYTADVHVESGRNIRNVALYLWRIGAYAVSGVDARAAEGARGRWTFDPAGRDVPLFHRPRTEPSFTHRAEQLDVPDRLRRRDLADPRTTPFLAGTTPALHIRVGGPDAHPLAPAALVCTDLSTWASPPSGAAAAFDPETGRLTLPERTRQERVTVDYAYGYPGDLGAGPYERGAASRRARALIRVTETDVSWRVRAGRGEPAKPSIKAALQSWNELTPQSGGRVGVITVEDSATYPGDLIVRAGPGDRLLLVADTGARPHVRGRIEVTGPKGSAVVLDGFSVEGGVVSRSGKLVVASCTVGGTGIEVGAPTQLLRCVSERVQAADAGARLHLTESIVRTHLLASKTDVVVRACTVLGNTEARRLTVNDTILRGSVAATNVTASCSRLPAVHGSRHRCVDSEPTFTSTEAADPGFAQLRDDCPEDIRHGAENRGEMGAYGFVAAHLRVTNLLSQLDTYLRFGLEAGLFFAT